jgi:hypothetical protein
LTTSSPQAVVAAVDTWVPVVAAEAWLAARVVAVVVAAVRKVQAVQQLVPNRELPASSTQVDGRVTAQRIATPHLKVVVEAVATTAVVQQVTTEVEAAVRVTWVH